MSSSSGRIETGSGRVSIPSSVKKTIEDIKEITGKNHSDDEIYAMLKECSMDPNETAQNLLLLDTFHEVKKKRDRRKEIVFKEAAESKWKPGTQVRANRGRGNYSSRYISHDAGGGRSLAGSSENATGPLLEKGTRKVPLSTSQEMRRDGNSSKSSVAAKVARDNNVSVDGDLKKSFIGDSSNSAASISSEPSSGSYFSSSDPVLLQSKDSSPHNPVGTIRREVRESIAVNSSESKQDAARILSPGPGISNLQQKMPKEQIRHLEPVLPVSSTIGVSAVSRPSSNHSSRSQVIDPPIVGVGNEWKLNPTNSSVGQGATVASSSETVSVGSHPIPMLQPTSVAPSLKKDTSELGRKLEESHISVGQHVIIPDHLHVPEAEKLGFCFGSFDASFGLGVNDKNPSLPEFEAIDESVKGIQLSYENVSVDSEDTEVNYVDQSQSSTLGPESSVVSKVEISPADAIDGSNQEIAHETKQHLVVHTSSNYNFGFMPPMVNSQLATSESSEFHVRDAPRQPGFVVQQPFDPASYYVQFYRSGMDSDGRLSPFHSAAAASKYSGNAAIIYPQTSQSQESGGPPVLSTASSTSLVTQAAGVMQSSINTHHLPIFRQPTGVHLPHYPPNFFPYGPYFSRFYVPPPAMHQFINNGAFPQQPQAGNLYPTPPGATAKYSIPQQKQNGSNTANSTHIPGSYPPYGISMSNYSSSSATSTVTLTANEDHHAAPQVKENNIFNEGSGGVWFANPNQDISGALQSSTSLYNHLPQAGQLAFAPTQPTFPGIFHPAAQAATVRPLLQHFRQPITTSAVVAVGPTSSVHQQQPHHQQLNWPNNN